MSIYDIVMLIVFAAAVLFGLWKGLAWQVASLAAVFVSYFVAMEFRGQLAPLIKAQEPWNRFAAMLILYLGTSLLIWLAYGYVRRTIEKAKLRTFDRQAGAILGAAKGAVLCMLVTLFSVTLLGDQARDAIVQSRSGGWIAGAISRMDAIMPDELHAYLDKYIHQFENQIIETDPDFLNRSQQQLDAALETFKGQWSESSDPPPQFGGLRGGFQTSPERANSAASAAASDPLKPFRDWSTQTAERLKETGREAMRDTIDRAAEEARNRLLGPDGRRN